MDQTALIGLAYTMMGDRKSHAMREPGWLFRHGLRTAHLALRLRQHIFPHHADWDDRLFAAALFHDVGKGEPHHHEAGARICQQALVDFFNEGELEDIARLVYEHDNRFHPELSDPIKLLQDADLIDHSGTIDVWINLYRYTATEGSPEQAVAHFMDHNVTHQHRRQQKLNYAYSRQIQRERFEYSQAFFERFEQELMGNILLKV